MNFDSVYTVKKEFGKDDFIRELLIELATSYDTPVDIVDADFGEVRESVREVILCTAHVQGRCTASVGYDHQEPYIDYEKYREKIGDRYVERERPVTKYRTVTDWKLFQTEYSGNATCAAYNSDDFGYDDGEIVTAIKTADKDSIVEKGEATVNLSGLATVKASCENNVELHSVSFPGDRHRDVNYNSNSEIQSLSCFKLPFYEVKYNYKGENYFAYCFACGDINIQAEMPDNDIDITALVKQKTKRFEKRQKTRWTLFALSFILAAILCFAIDFAWLFPLPIILLIAAKKASDKYRKKYKECSDALSKNVAEAKISALKTALQKRGYRPLSRELSKDLEGTSVPGAAELKSVKGRTVLSWILVIIFTIISVVKINSAHQAKLHSPEQVEIKVISKEVEYDPDAGSYINGCYYIYFDYEIEAKKTGVEYIELKVYVDDKDGNEIGYIRSSLSYINADPGDTKVITVSLEEHQPEKNEFFTELYNCDFSELEFRYEIGHIKFSDGKYYNNDEYDKFN